MTEIVRWTDRDPVDDQRTAHIAASRGTPTVAGTMTPLDAEHSGWIAQLLDDPLGWLADIGDHDEPGDDR